MLMHPSSLSRIMTEPKTKKEGVLSVGAKTYCREIAKQYVYGAKKEISNKYLDKGIIVEDQSIELYNEVFFTDLKKNTERRSNDWLTGECDLFTPNKIIDIKSSWSIDTFPATKQDAHSKEYEWQGRGYMMLWDVDLFELAYCLVDTPSELIGWEDEEQHVVGHIDPELRITTVLYNRDMEQEGKIKEKCEAAQEYINQVIQQIADEHSGV